MPSVQRSHRGWQKTLRTCGNWWWWRTKNRRRLCGWRRGWLPMERGLRNGQRLRWGRRPLSLLRIALHLPWQRRDRRRDFRCCDTAAARPARNTRRGGHDPIQFLWHRGVGNSLRVPRCAKCGPLRLAFGFCGLQRLHLLALLPGGLSCRTRISAKHTILLHHRRPLLRTSGRGQVWPSSCCYR